MTVLPEKRPDRTLGPGHDTFWAWCDKEELHLPRCTACTVLMWPIEPACTTCGGTDFAWEALSGRGTIVSWCTFEHDYYQGQLPIPWETVLVELTEGPLFLSNPRGMTRHDMRVGLPVRVAFLPCEDGAGPFKLPVFEADGAGAPPHINLSSEEVVL
jgi:uncharacterized OB-fold protein